MLIELPFDVMKTDGFIPSIVAFYITYSPTTYSLHEEGVGVGRKWDSL